MTQDIAGIISQIQSTMSTMCSEMQNTPDTFCSGILEAFDKIYMMPQWQVKLNEKIQFGFDGIETQHKFISTVRDGIPNERLSYYDQLMKEWATIKEAFTTNGGLITPLRLGQSVTALQPLSDFMTEIASLYHVPVLNAITTKNMTFNRKVLVTAPYVLRRPWHWFKSDPPSDLSVPDVSSTKHLSATEFLNWMYLSINAVGEEHSVIKASYKAITSMSPSDLLAECPSIGRLTLSTDIWTDQEWSLIDSHKWQAVELAWRKGRCSPNTISLAAGLTLRDSLLRACPTLNRIRRTLSLFRDHNVTIPEVDLAKAKTKLLFMKGEWPADDEEEAANSLCDKNNNSIHSLIRKIYGEAYDEDRESEVQQVSMVYERSSTTQPDLFLDLDANGSAY